MSAGDYKRPAGPGKVGPKAAAVVYLTAAEELTLNSTILVVWNVRYQGWCLPGGLIEEDESPMMAAWRELAEESSLTASDLTPAGLRALYSATAERGEIAILAHGGDVYLHPQRGSYVYVFQGATVHPERARTSEPGCEIDWVTQSEFLQQCPFRKFYEIMFRRLATLRGQR